VENTFTAGDSYEFPFGTDPDYLVDVLAADEGTLFFKCQDRMGRSVFYDEGSYKTICSSTIFGAMADGEGSSTKTDLMTRYFSFLVNDPDPHIWASISELDFGIQYLNYPNTKSFNIRNLGYEYLNISSIDITGEGFIYEGETEFTLGWGEQTELEITFNAQNQGTFNATLIIECDDPEISQLSVLLTAECILAPEIQISQNSYNINLEQDSVVEEVLTISNTGNSDLSYQINLNDLSLPLRDAGGPDNYDYLWIDSNEPNGPVYNWRDISELGTIVDFTHNDVGTELMPIGFDFNFYGTTYSQFRINPNGWIGFGDDWVDYHNYELPKVNAPRPAIFPFWDDLDPIQGGNVYYYCTVDSLIVWFDNVIHYPGIYNGTYNFQMILYPGGRMLFQYHTVQGDLNTSTIGLQNESGNDALQIIFDAPYVENELAIEIYSGPKWLELSKNAGTIPVGSYEDISITFNSANLEEATYEAEVIIVSNDPAQSEIVVPLTLIIGTVTADVEFTVGINKLIGNYPNPFYSTTSISFSIAENEEDAEIIIYNLKGQKVRVLEYINSFDAQATKSLSQLTWNGKDENNKPVASGVYFYKLKAGKYSNTKKMILMR